MQRTTRKEASACDYWKTHSADLSILLIGYVFDIITAIAQMLASVRDESDARQFGSRPKKLYHRLMGLKLDLSKVEVFYYSFNIKNNAA